MKVKIGDKVKVHYIGKEENGEIFDSSREIEGTDFSDREPLEFVLGEGTLIPGFENAVVGLEVGENTTTEIPSDEAYGDYLDNLKQEVNVSNLPENVTTGSVVQSTSNGQMVFATVESINESLATLDYNHPLAGKNLTFEIELIEHCQ